MQTKLSQIALIPILIQSTLGDAIENVTTTTATDTEEINCITHAVSSSSSTIVAEQETITQSSIEVEATVIQESAANETVAMTEDANEIICDEVCFSPPTTPERDLEPDVMNEQQLKMREMEKSWPWKDEDRKIHK